MVMVILIVDFKMIYKSKILSNVLGLILALHVMQNLDVYANQIENCHSNMFLDISKSRYRNNDFYDTSESIIDVNINAIKEEVKLFDWEELLRDITPILQECEADGVGHSCTNRYAIISLLRDQHGCTCFE